ncbi:MAG: hypothetical protein QNJ05_02710 [Woeseiaceae bacterium]|nr:hypothetical protein [Woeseiaceae bacterium]
MSRKKGARSGIFFGAASGVITTIGLIAGLHAGTSSTSTVLGGILVIAVADSMSDALGMHLAEESKPGATHHQVWAATVSTFVTKLIFALSFAIPLLLLPLNAAVIASISWGMVVIVLLSIYIARARNVRSLPIIAEHLGIAILVVVLSHLIGDWVSRAFAG